jgi:hypothetical protein
MRALFLLPILLWRRELPEPGSWCSGVSAERRNYSGRESAALCRDAATRLRFLGWAREKRSFLSLAGRFVGRIKSQGRRLIEPPHVCCYAMTIS